MKPGSAIRNFFDKLFGKSKATDPKVSSPDIKVDIEKEFENLTTPNKSDSELILTPEKFDPKPLIKQKQEPVIPIEDPFVINPKNMYQEIDLVIGFDFGTSTSKVVIQAPDLPGSPARAVDFGSLGLEELPYLLPTKIWINMDGDVSLEEKNDYKLFSDLKINLLPGVNIGNRNKSSILETAVIAICYIAKVLRLSREWYLAENKSIIGRPNKINWSFNLGVPSPFIDNNEEHALFKRIGRSAWILSLTHSQTGSINSKEAEDIFNNLPQNDNWPESNEASLRCEFNIIPEIAGGAVGYAFSDLRRNGLHVIVDIGAGTVDVCMFILWNDNISNRYSLLTADVKPLGTAMYHRHMLDLIGPKNGRSNEGNKITNNSLQKPITDIGELLKYCHSQGYNAITDIHLQKRKSNFESKVDDALKKIIWRTKMKRDPNSPTWKKEKTLPIIMIGGGSRSVIYLDSIKRLSNWLKREVGNGGFTEVLSVDLPALAKHVKPEYLAVAWGLSHRALDIGHIIPPDRINDIDPPPKVDPDPRNDDD